VLPIIYDGTGKPQAERLALRAGKVSLIYEAGKLRYVSVGGREILRGIYAAVRDKDWGTIPGELRDVNADVNADSFHITFTSDHKGGDLHFVWRGEIVGTTDGTIRFTFDGEALTTFQRNRIGFCVLHPLTLAGQPCLIEHTDGSEEAGMFPDSISPHQPYFDIRAVRHDVLPGISVEVRMEGDTFEMEDQRNWSDASYKTYCTPLALGYPKLIEAGTKVQQRITIRVIGDADDVPMVKQGNVLHIDAEQRWKIPFVGLGMASHDEPLTERDYERLAALNLSHLRHDLFFSDEMEERLYEAVEDANALETDLEVAAHFGENVRAELARLHKALDDLDHGDMFMLVKRHGEMVTDPETFKLVQEALDDEQGVFPVLGTDDNFTELNRQRPPVGLSDRVWYATNPQVHAFDNATLVEAFPTMAQAVANARSFSKATVLVSRVTLKSPPHTDPASMRDTDPPKTLPFAVDPRQMSLFGAGWVVGAVAALARGGAESITFFETTGWLGVMERESGSPLPDQFPSIPGTVFPMYHVLADVGEFLEGRVLAAESSQPLVFNGLALREGSRWRVIAANHTPEPQTVTIIGLDGAWTMRALDETTADNAMRDPEGYRSMMRRSVEAVDGSLRVELLPYAVVTLDKV
jgi:hypothetical protein